MTDDDNENRIILFHTLIHYQNVISVTFVTVRRQFAGCYAQLGYGGSLKVVHFHMLMKYHNSLPRTFNSFMLGYDDDHDSYPESRAQYRIRTVDKCDASRERVISLRPVLRGSWPLEPNVLMTPIRASRPYSKFPRGRPGMSVGRKL